jgi:hypothetical protein
MRENRFIKVSFIVGWYPDQDEMGNDFEQADESAVILPYTSDGIEIAMRGIRRAFRQRLVESVGIAEMNAHGLGPACYFEGDGGQYFRTLDEEIEHRRSYLQRFM